MRYRVPYYHPTPIPLNGVSISHTMGHYERAMGRDTSNTSLVCGGVWGVPKTTHINSF